MDRENQSYMPIEQLDLPQAILIHWGHILPWIWSTWDNPGVANTEYLPVVVSFTFTSYILGTSANICTKTATWLLHLHETVSELDIASVIFFDVKASSQAMSVSLTTFLLLK